MNAGKRRGVIAFCGGIAASMAGVSFASGREIAAFFGQLGLAAWVGIPFAAVAFALLVGLIGHYARTTGARSFAGVCRRLSGKRLGAAIGLLYALLMQTTTLAMLAKAGELGALALPVRNAWLWGAGIALMTALAVNAGGLRLLPAMGLLAFAMAFIFYSAMALDMRPVRVYLRCETAMALSGNVWAAILLAVMYAALSACLAGGMIVRMGGVSGLGAAAAICGGGLCALLLCANAALLRGGTSILGQAMPMVVLAARWGIVGFWWCVALQYLCAVATLTATLGALMAQPGEGGPERRYLLAIVSAAALAYAGTRLNVFGRICAALCRAGAACVMVLACRGARRTVRRG